MSKLIVGYTASKKNRLRPILIVIAVLVFALFGLWIISLGQAKEEKPIQKQEKVEKPQKKVVVAAEQKPKAEESPIQPAGIRVLDRATCRSIKNNLPQEISSVFPPETQVYFYTQVMAEKAPQTIRHVWINPRGEVYASVDLRIANQPADTWSYISLPPKSEGMWTVRVAAGDKVFDELRFQVE